MKKILTVIAVAICTFATVAAQDLESLTETYNNAAAAIETDKTQAISLFEQALEAAGVLGEEGNEIAAQCKGILPKLYLQVGKELANAKDMDGAMEKIQKAAALAEEFGDAETAADAKELGPQILMMDANSLLRAKDYANAAAAYQKVIDIDPANGDALFYKGQALSAAGDMDGAIKALTLASENGKEEASAKLLSNIYVKKAVACQKAKDMKGALENAQASTQYVDNANAEKIIGTAALSLKQYKVSADGFEAYLAMKPDAADKAQTMYQLGTALVGAGENSKACGYFKQIAQDAKWGEAARYQITTLKCQ